MIRDAQRKIPFDFSIISATRSPSSSLKSSMMLGDNLDLTKASISLSDSACPVCISTLMILSWLSRRSTWPLGRLVMKIRRGTVGSILANMDMSVARGREEHSSRASITQYCGWDKAILKIRPRKMLFQTMM